MINEKAKERRERKGRGSSQRERERQRRKRGYEITGSPNSLNDATIRAIYICICMYREREREEEKWLLANGESSEERGDEWGMWHLKASKRQEVKYQIQPSYFLLFFMIYKPNSPSLTFLITFQFINQFCFQKGKSWKGASKPF